MDVRVNSKCSFIGFNPKVYDENGIFYIKEGRASFNLPPGEYNIINAEPNGTAIVYKCPMLPFPEKLNVLPKLSRLKLLIADNAYGQVINKAAVCVSKNELFLNEQFFNYPTVHRLCLLAHELGHYIYKTEYKCDLFAINHLIKYGLNPSQFVSFINLLSDFSDDRMEIATTYCEKIK